MIQSRLCDLLGIQYPVFQGGMAWIADGKLAAAVSEGGGLGIIAAMNANADWLRGQIREIRAMLAEDGADAALMSGSGSAVFALSRDIAVLERLRQKAEALGCDSWLTQRC